MRPKGTPEELKRRRDSAMELLRRDFSLNEVARKVGCSPSSVGRWRDAEKMERIMDGWTDLFELGLSQDEVARRQGCSPSSIKMWKKAHDYLNRRTTGRPRKLTFSQERILDRCLRQGGLAHGYPTDSWTIQRIAELIEKKFEVRYHRSNIGRLVRRLI